MKISWDKKAVVELAELLENIISRVESLEDKSVCQEILSKRVADLEQYVDYQKSLTQQPQPAQPERKATLVEVCEEILELTKSARFSIAEWNLLADACDRHKKREELVDELKRIIRVWQNRGCSESSVITAIDALDAFDKERGV